ncbi:MAG: DUF4340 domain-containing protein [Anaerolineales bacterium]
MIRRNTWIAIGVLAVTVILALVLNQTEEPGVALEPTPAPQSLWAVSTDEIVAITVEDRAAGRVLKFERSAEDLWKMIGPDEGPTDAARVERAASWLSSPSPQAQLFDIENLEEFGLIAPEYRVQMLLANGSQLEFSVGRETPTGSSRYVISPRIDGILIMSSLGLGEVLGLVTIINTLERPHSTPEAGSYRALAT